MFKPALARPNARPRHSHAALFGALALSALGAAAVAGTFLLMSPVSSLGAAQTPAPASSATPAPSYKFAKDLAAAGVVGCAPVIETMASSLMQGATEFATASSWDKDAPNSRIVSSLTGQKFGGSPTVPNGVAGVFASPHSDGKCDGVSVQIVPSPASCANLQATIEKSGKMLGALAGVPLLSSGNGQIMLVPTGANTCIIVGVQVAYAK